MSSCSPSRGKKRKTMEENEEDVNNNFEMTSSHHRRDVAENFQQYFENPWKLLPSKDIIQENFFIEDDTPLILAIREVNVGAVNGLLAAGVNPNAPNQKGVTPISAASHKGDIMIMQKLVDYGAAVNAINSTGSTALIQAAHFGHHAAVKLLLKHGSIADFANSKGTTALMRASQEGYANIVVTLLSANSEVNRKNHEGMNSLMLASQRGHDQVVLVLVKYGAAIDEQTSQGSTALMLACKRGHERVVEVLVACGAEIYMRDCRARSARDTALRRNHATLLTYLNTQIQVRCLQETAREERAALLRCMRADAIQSKLHFTPETARILRVMHEVDRFECSSGSDRLIDPLSFVKILQKVLGKNAPSVPDAVVTSYANRVSWSAGNFQNSFIFPSDVCVANIHSPVSSSFVATAPYRARHPVRPPSVVSPQRPGYAPWKWPLILMKVFDLPLGVHELVLEFLPYPRLWKNNIQRLKRRVTLAPQAATLDISIMLDEMLTDMCLFRPPRDRAHLVTLSRNREVTNYLSEQWQMPTSLIDELVQWSDVQSLIERSSDCDVTFKANLARKFLLVAAALYRFLSSYSNPRIVFSVARQQKSSRKGAWDFSKAAKEKYANTSPVCDEGGKNESAGEAGQTQPSVNVEYPSPTTHSLNEVHFKQVSSVSDHMVLSFDAFDNDGDVNSDEDDDI